MMMGNGRALSRDRWRGAIVLGTGVDRPVPEEHRDQPELHDSSQRTEPTRALHWDESMRCPVRRHCPAPGSIPRLHSIWAPRTPGPNADDAAHQRRRPRLTPTTSPHPAARCVVIDRRRLSDRCCGRAGRRLALIQSDTRAERVDKFRTTLGPAELRAGPLRSVATARIAGRHREASFTSTLCRSVRNARTPHTAQSTKE